MKKQLKSLKQSNEDAIDMVHNNKIPEKAAKQEQPIRGRCKYCNGTTKEKKNSAQHSEKHATTVVRKTILPVHACKSKKKTQQKAF